MIKIILYAMVIPLVSWSVDSVNFDVFFKKGDINKYRARIFYMMFVVGFSYLIVNFLWDFFGVIS